MTTTKVAAVAAPEREWLNVREAAAWVGMSVQSIRNARTDGYLVAKRTAGRGGKELYRVSELREWIESLEDVVGA